MAALSDDMRDYFDEFVEEVIESLPASIRKTLESVPLIVEDRPTKSIMKSMQVADPDELQGLYSHSPPTIHLFRRGILLLSTTDDDEIDEDELVEQIRVTILHEIAHHRGFDEGEVGELGYE